MLSSLLGNSGDLAASFGLMAGSSSGRVEFLDAAGCGLAPLSEQSEYERAYAPLPSPTGELVHDPDFTLPTTAGPLPWRLFYYSSLSQVDGPFGNGRRASWPLRLLAERNPVDGSVITVMLEREDGLGARYVSTDTGGSYKTITPRVFDQLEGSPTSGFTETRIDSGTTFNYPALYESDATDPPTCGVVSLSYYQTVHDQTVNFNYTAGLLDTIQDPAERTIQYTYNDDGHVVKIEDWAGRVTTFSYSGGNLVTVQDPEGYVASYTYDSKNHLTAIEDPNGNFTTLMYDPQSRVTSRQINQNLGQYRYLGSPATGQTIGYQDPMGQIWTTITDSMGNVTSVEDPLAATRLASYNDYGQPILIQDAVLRQTHMDYDSGTASLHNTGRMKSLQEPQQGPNIYTPDIYGNITSHTDPLGRVTSYDFGSGTDAEARLLRQTTDYLGNITTFTYLPWGALNTVQDPLGHITSYTWDDDKAVLLGEENPLGGRRTYTYDDAGNRITELDEMDRPTEHTYDKLSRRTSTTNGIGAVRSSIYDGVNLIATVDPLGFRTSYSHDAEQRETAELDAHGYFHTTVYDAKGRETARIDPNGHVTQSVWDRADRRIARIDALGHITTTGYDAARRPISLQDSAGLIYGTDYNSVDPSAGMSAIAQIAPSGHRTTSIYDVAGQLIQTVDTVGLRTKYNYDRVGRLQSTQQPTGALTTTAYDANGRAVTVMNALGFVATSVYDWNGHLTISIDPEGKRYTTAYDLSGHRTREDAPDGTWVERFYDAAGRNNANLDYRGFTTYTGYDLNDQVQSFTDEYGNIVTDQYDAVGQVTLSYDTQGNISLTTYDPARRPYLYQDTTGNISTTMYHPTGAVKRYLAGLDQSFTYMYDGAGRFQASQTALGETTTTAYDGHGRVKAQITPDGVPTTLMYDGFSRWAAQQDLFGYLFTTNFDVHGREVGYTDELGYSTTLILDILDRPVGQMDPLGYVTSYMFDKVGRIASRQDAKGAVTTSVYDGRGNQIATVDAYGNATTSIYDMYSRRIATENPLGYRTTTGYDGYGRIATVMNARGYVTTTVYDYLSRPWATVDALGHRTTTIYDNLGRFQATQDPLGNLSTTVYDQLNRVIGQVDPLGYRTSTIYDSLGRVWASEDALGNRSTTIYDSVGRVLAQEDALGFRTTSVYDGRGSTLATIDARGHATTFAYDGRRQQVSVMDALGNIATSVYDGLGRQYAQVNALGYRSTTIYDSVGRVAAVQDPLGYLTTSVYDLLGRTIATQDALGRMTTSVYDAASRTVAQVNALGQATTNLYDPNGNRVGWMNGLGYVTTSLYDAVDRQAGWTDPLGRMHTLSFDGAGRIVSQVDALGSVTTHAWDGRGLETLRTLADGQSFSWMYDGRGQEIAAQDGTGITTSVYDSLGRLSQVLGPDYPGAVTMSYQFDGVGNRTGVSSTYGQFTYGYDRRNLLSTLEDPGYPTAGIAGGGVTSWSYDALGRPVRQQNGDGSSSTMSYDAVGRTLQVWHAKLDGSEIDRAFYAFDAVGRPLYKDAMFARHTFVYDAIDQLSEEHISFLESDGVTPGVRITTWSYDAAQRRVGQNINGVITTNMFDRADQLLWAQTPGGFFVTFGYDANGSRITAEARRGAVTTYTWDAAVRLSALTAPDGTSNTFTYDRAGLRHGHVGPDGGVDALLWDPSSGAPMAYLGTGGDATLLGQLFVQNPDAQGFVKAMGTTRLGLPVDRQYHTNAQGTVGALTDAQSGAGLATSTFDAWGVPLAKSGGGESAGPALPSAYDPVVDFTVNAATATSANGAWQYGSMADISSPATEFGVYSLVTMTWGGVTGFPGYYTTAAAGVPMLLCNQTSPPSTIATGSLRVPPGFLEMHPGPEDEYSVLRFVAPTAGVYAVSGQFQGQDTGGTSTDVHIFQITASTGSSVSLLNRSVNGFYGGDGGSPSGTSPVVPFDLPGVLLAAGDSLMFAVGFGSVNYYSDSTGLSLQITPVTSFDAVAEFSPDAATATSANGVWQYGELPDLSSPATSFGVYTITTLTYAGVAGFSGYYATGGLPMVLGNFASPPATIVDGSVHLPVGFLEMHPGSSGQYSAVRFVAPAAGTYGFAGQFQGQDSGGTSTDVHILRIAAATSTSTSLFASAVNGFYAGTPPAIVPFDLRGVALAAGDSVLFVVGDGGGTYYADSTGLAVTATVGAAGSHAADDPFGYLGGLGYWQDPALADTAGSGLSYVRQRWLENATGQWLSVDPVASEPRYGYAHNMPTTMVDPQGMDGILGFSDWKEVRSTLHYFGAIFNQMYVTPTEQYLHSSWKKMEQGLNQAQAMLTHFGHQIASLPIVKNLVPTSWDADHVGQWVYGIGVGIFRGIVGLLPIGFAAEIIYDLLWDVFMKHKGFLQAFVEMVHGFAAGPAALFKTVLNITDKERGEILGNLLVTIIILLIVIFTGGAAAPALAAVPGNLVKATARAAEAFGAGLGRVGESAGQAGRALAEIATPRPAFAGAAGAAGGFRATTRTAASLVRTVSTEGSEAGAAATQGAAAAAKASKQIAEAGEEISKVKDLASVTSEAVKSTTDALGKAGSIRLAEILGELSGKTYRNSEFYSEGGKTLGEIDNVIDGVFVEEKAATGIGTQNPKTGISQTPGEWAERQIYSKTATKIRRLPDAVRVIPQPKNPHATAAQPSAAAMQHVRAFKFVTEGDYPGLGSAIQQACDKLANEFGGDGWTFSFSIGGK